MNRETGKNWAWLSVIWSLSLAYCAAVIVYQAFQIAYTPVSAISYITAALTTLGVIIAGMRYFADRIEFKPKVSSKCGSCK
jgi:ferrous iron transport protein B